MIEKIENLIERAGAAGQVRLHKIYLSDVDYKALMDEMNKLRTYEGEPPEMALAVINGVYILRAGALAAGLAMVDMTVRGEMHSLLLRLSDGAVLLQNKYEPFMPTMPVYEPEPPNPMSDLRTATMFIMRNDPNPFRPGGKMS